MKNFLKKIGTIAMFAIPAVLQAQNITYRIKGQIGRLSAPAKVYVEYLDDSRKEHIDSVVINNGSFTVTGKVDCPTLVTIFVNEKGTGLDWHTREHLSLILENGDISVTSPDFIQNAKISGGPVSADYNRLALALKDKTDKLNELSNIYFAASPEKRGTKEFIDSLQKQGGLIGAEEKPIYLSFIKANPSSIVSLFAVMDYSDVDEDVKDIEAAFDLLSAQVKGSNKGIDFAIKINQMKKTAIGAVAPDFTLPDSLGKAISLHDFKGKYVLVDFWASWCVPCRKENPNVLKAYNAYHDKNFTVLGISLDGASSKNAWLKAVQDDHLSWTQVCGLNGLNSNAAQLYGIQHIPQNFLISPDGKIVASNLRGEDLINKLQQLLGQ